MRASHVLCLAFSLTSVGIALAGCQHNETTVFPPGLEPLGTDSVAPPAMIDGGADGGSDYPETLSLTQGSTSDYNWVMATGYVDASVADVWAAFKMPNVVVDRHHISSYTVQENVETGYDVSFATTYTDNNVVTVSFVLTWREGVIEGTVDDPSQVSVVYEKTYGSSFVSLMQGSFELTAVTPTVTELQFVQHMSAQSTNSQTIADWSTDLFASIVAQVHGQPLP